MIYASTFTSGTEKYVKLLLSKFHTSVRILSSFDGLIIYSCDLDSKHIAQIRYFTNSFILISEYKKSNILGMSTLIQEELQYNNIEKITNSYFHSPKKFRIVFTDKNTPVSVSNDLRQSLENKISKNKYLTVNRVLPDYEFWLLKRKEHVAFFLLRLTYNQTAERLYRKGELHREVCQILNEMSEPKKNDVFLDPFCGYASLGLERLYSGECAKIICVDNDVTKIGEVHHRVARSPHPSYFEVHNNDFFSMDFPKNSIDKVVTDPPWGDFTKIENIGEFFNKLLSKLKIIVKKDGIIVLLTSRKQEFEEELKKFDNFKKLDKIDILVSGKKAAVYKIIN